MFGFAQSLVHFFLLKEKLTLDFIINKYKFLDANVLSGIVEHESDIVT